MISTGRFCATPTLEMGIRLTPTTCARMGVAPARPSTWTRSVPTSCAVKPTPPDPEVEVAR